MTEQIGQPDERPQGIFIRGEYLGIEESREFSPRDDPASKRTVRPKIGLRVNGEEVPVTARDDAHAAQARKGLVKGDIVELQVEPLPPFGTRGDVRYTLPGVFDRSRKGDWK